MSLDHAILVSLSEKSASGYDLARRFDASIGHFWRASHQQIYKVLGRMEGAGWVAAEHVAQDSRPDKKVYAVTAAGRAELSRWLAEPTPPEPLRSAFTVKLRGLPFGDRESVLEDVRRRRAEHATRLAYYEASEKRTYPDPSRLEPSELGAYLALRGGIRVETGGIQWCDEILSVLDPGLDASGPDAARESER